MRKFMLFSSLLIVPTMARAHFLWIIVDPASKLAHIEIAESPGKDIAPILNKFKGDIVTRGLGELKSQADGGALTAAFAKGSVALATFTYGLHGTDLVTWWAKGATDLKAASAPCAQDYEILVKRSGSGFVATVFRKGKTVSGAKVEAYNSGVAIGGDMKSDAHGNVKIQATTKGMLQIGAIVVEPGGGEYKKQHFTDRMILVTTTFPLG